MGSWTLWGYSWFISPSFNLHFPVGELRRLHQRALWICNPRKLLNSLLQSHVVPGYITVWISMMSDIFSLSATDTLRAFFFRGTKYICVFACVRVRVCVCVCACVCVREREREREREIANEILQNEKKERHYRKSDWHVSFEGYLFQNEFVRPQKWNRHLTKWLINVNGMPTYLRLFYT